MENKIIARPLTGEEFAPFGEVIEKQGAQQFAINDGLCTRFHDLATIEFSGPSAKPLLSIFSSKPWPLPLALNMVERHPLGSQAFMPFLGAPFLVIVAPDHDGKPGHPLAFVTAQGQGINFRKNTWHGVLSPMQEPADFLVIDRGGEGDNLEEYTFSEPYFVTL